MCGISSGTNVAAAKRLAKKLGKGKTVVTLIPDTAERYFSTALFKDGKIKISPSLNNVCRYTKGSNIEGDIIEERQKI